MSLDLLRFMLVGVWFDGAPGGLLVNIVLALLTFAIGFLIAIPLGLARLRGRWFFSAPATAFVEVIRATPLLLLVFWCHFTLPILSGGVANPLLSALVGLSLYASAYLAEIVRAGFMSVPRGEIEAALAAGMTPLQASLHIVVPQGLRRMLPACSSFAVSLFKDTAVIYVVGVIDLLQAGLITAERKPSQMLSIYLLMAMGFFVVSGLISFSGRLLENRLGLTRRVAA